MALLFCYWANGLRIGSNIALPELQDVECGELDLMITKGPVPGVIEDAYFSGPVVQVSSNEFLLKIKGTARFLVTGDNHIQVDIEPGSSEDVARLFILSTLIGVVLHKRDILALHASAVKINDGVVLFAGVSGAGKSTIALGFHNKGYDIVNDDISAIGFENNEPMVYSGYRHLKLWKESTQHYSIETQGLSRIRQGIEKYSFPIKKADDTRHKLKAIFLLELVKSGEIRHETISTFEKLEMLKQHTFRSKMIQRLKKDAAHFRSCSLLINKVPVVKLYRPENVQPHLFVNYVEALLETL